MPEMILSVIVIKVIPFLNLFWVPTHLELCRDLCVSLHDYLNPAEIFGKRVALTT